METSKALIFCGLLLISNEHCTDTVKSKTLYTFAILQSKVGLLLNTLCELKELLLSSWQENLHINIDENFQNS